MREYLIQSKTDAVKTRLHYLLFCCNINYNIKYILVERVFDMVDNRNVFYGNVSNIQIQQNAINSTQVQNINQECDYSEVLSLLRQLQEDIGTLGLDNQAQSEVKKLIDTVESSIGQKEPQSKIRQGLNLLKEFLMRTTTSLAATGAVTLITNLINTI